MKLNSRPIRSKIILITVTFLLSGLATIYAANWLLTQQTIIQQETDRFLKKLQPQEAPFHILLLSIPSFIIT